MGSHVDAEEREKRRRERWALSLLLLFQGLEDDLHAVAHRYADGKITLEEFGNQTLSLLLPAHIQAAYIGRRKAGIDGPLDEHDEAFGTEAAEHEVEFVDGFVSDLKDGKYLHPPTLTDTLSVKPTVDVEAIVRRLTLYAMGVAATANEAWVEALPDTTYFLWRDVKDEAECTDCRRNARQGPYTRETLPSIPGDGRTRCKRNCRCEIVTQDNQRSFDLRHLFDGAALIDGEG